MNPEEQSLPAAGPPLSAACAAALAAGRLLSTAGRPAEAVRYLRDAQAAAPEDGEVNYELGRALVAAGAVAVAIAPLRRAARRADYADRAWFELGVAETQRRRWARAAASFRRALRLKDDWFEAHLSYGAALFRLGRAGAAGEAAGMALRLNPGAIAAHRLLGASLFRQRRFAEAAGAFSAWAQQAPEEALAALSTARALFLAGERQAAEEACRDAVRRDPNLLRGHLLLARIALAENKLREAQVHLRHAVASRREGASLRAMLARVMMRRSRFEAAAKTAEAALGDDPACHSAALVIAELHIVNGETGKAAAILSELERQCPDWAEPRVLREELRRKRDLPRELPAGPPPVPREFPFGGDGEAEARSDPAPLQRGDLPNPPPPRGFAAAAVSVAPFEAQTDLFDHVFQIRALILRELRLHHRGTRLGFLLEYVRPALVMTLHYVIFTAINKYMPAKIPVELFIIGSFTTWYACAHVIRATMGGKKHTADIQGVTEIHLAIAKTVWEFFSMFSFCIFCVAVLALIGWPEPVPEIPATVVNFALAVCLGLGIGLILQALGRVFPSMDMLKKPVLWILFITSGHYFSISGGRHGLWMYMWFNPCLHLAELQRHAFDPGYPTQLVTVWYPAVTAAGLIITGLMLNKWTRQRGLD